MLILDLQGGVGFEKPAYGPLYLDKPTMASWYAIICWTDVSHAETGELRNRFFKPWQTNLVTCLAVASRPFLPRGAFFLGTFWHSFFYFMTILTTIQRVWHFYYTPERRNGSQIELRYSHSRIEEKSRFSREPDPFLLLHVQA